MSIIVVRPVVKHGSHNQKDHAGKKGRTATSDEVNQAISDWTDRHFDAAGLTRRSDHYRPSAQETKAIIAHRISERMSDVPTTNLIEAVNTEDVPDSAWRLAAKAKQALDPSLKDEARVALDENGSLVILSGTGPFTRADVHTRMELAEPGSPLAEDYVRRAAVGAMVSSWAVTSNDDSSLSLAIQDAAERHFKIDGAAKWSTADKQAEMTARSGPVYERFVAAQHAETQEMFAAAGITSVEVHRGMVSREGRALPAIGSGVEVQSRPLSSWSTSQLTARGFSSGAGVFMSRTVPVSQIVSTWGTGNGCMGESEVVLIGGRNATDVQPGGFVKAAAAIINLDADDESADWIKTLAWDLPTEPDALESLFGPNWRTRLSRLPAWQAAPDSVKETVTKHGSHDQARHGRRGTSGGTAATLAAGNKVDVPASQVGGILTSLQNHEGAVDLTNLSVDGEPVFSRGNLGIAREDMPQIPKSHREQFLTETRNRGVQVTDQTVDPRTLQPTQGEMNAVNVAGMRASMLDGSFPMTGQRILVSSDGHVLDGHHRWAALTAIAYERPGTTIDITRVGMPIRDLLVSAADFNDRNGIEARGLGDFGSRVRKALGVPLLDEPVLKHPGHPDQKAHGRRHPSVVDPAVVSKTLELVRANGGLSIKMTDGSEPTGGYMVARDSSRFGRVVTAEEFFDPETGPAILAKHLIDNRAELGSGRAYLGVWHQTQEQQPDGSMRDLPFSEQLVHLDVTDQVMDRDRAVRLGRQRDQISVWDVANFEEIQTGGSGGAVAKHEAATGGRDSEAAHGDDRRRDSGLGAGAVATAHRAAFVSPLVKSVVVVKPVAKALTTDDDNPAVTKHGSHDQKDHGRRIGVHTGPRVGSKTREKLDKLLVHEATSLSALPPEYQQRVLEGVTNLGVTPEQIETNIEATLDRAIAEHGDPPPGTDWYDSAHEEANRIADENGLTPEQTAGMIAATSPQQAWGDNVTTTEYMARSLKENHEVQVDDLVTRQVTKTIKVDGQNTEVTKSAYEWAQAEVEGKAKDGEKRVMPSPDELRGQRLQDLDPYVAAAVMKAHAQGGYRVEGIGRPGLNVEGRPLQTLDDVTGAAGNVRFTCGTQHMGRAVRIARGEQVDEVINGHKVRSFFNNIRDPQNDYDDVTVDVHAFSVGMGTKYASGSVQYKYFSGSSWSNGRGVPPRHPAVGSATLGAQGLYPAFADAYRRVGQRRGLSARQVQAITWIQWRKENPDNQRGAIMREGEQ